MNIYTSQSSSSGYKVIVRAPDIKGFRTVVDGIKTMKLADSIVEALTQAFEDGKNSQGK
jgi:hypothetical protein